MMVYEISRINDSRDRAPTATGLRPSWLHLEE